MQNKISQMNVVDDLGWCMTSLDVTTDPTIDNLWTFDRTFWYEIGPSHHAITPSRHAFLRRAVGSRQRPGAAARGKTDRVAQRAVFGRAMAARSVWSKNWFQVSTRSEFLKEGNNISLGLLQSLYILLQETQYIFPIWLHILSLLSGENRPTLSPFLHDFPCFCLSNQGALTQDLDSRKLRSLAVANTTTTGRPCISRCSKRLSGLFRCHGLHWPARRVKQNTANTDTMSNTLTYKIQITWNSSRKSVLRWTQFTWAPWWSHSVHG